MWNILFAVIAVVVCNSKAVYYDVDLASLDINVVIKNPQAVENLQGCFVDTRPCGALPRRIKEIIPEAMEDGCKRCNSAHKRNAHIFFQHLKKERPELYEELKKKYDPNSKYIDNFEASIAQYDKDQENEETSP